jgi:hypothetical protein
VRQRLELLSGHSSAACLRAPSGSLPRAVRSPAAAIPSPSFLVSFAPPRRESSPQARAGATGAASPRGAERESG